MEKERFWTTAFSTTAASKTELLTRASRQSWGEWEWGLALESCLSAGCALLARGFAALEKSHRNRLLWQNGVDVITSLQTGGGIFSHLYSIAESHIGMKHPKTQKNKYIEGLGSY